MSGWRPSGINSPIPDSGHGGKLADDYRVNTAGKLMRRFWIDELPMLINWVKCDLKIVGVRLLTDWKYFWKAIGNIVFKGKRSK